MMAPNCRSTFHHHGVESASLRAEMRLGVKRQHVAAEADDQTVIGGSFHDFGRNQCVVRAGEIYLAYLVF